MSGPGKLSAAHSPRWRGLVLALAAVLMALAAVSLWVLGGPGPMTFAGGTTIALADYHAR